MPETESINPLLAIALIFAAGYPAGLLARRVGMPAVTGNILAGVLLGPSLIGVFPSTTAEDLELVTIFAMGLITVVIGGHLNYRRLHNAKRRIVSVAFLEITLTAGLVTSAVFLVGQEWQTAILLGAIATATAPATVLAVVREERAKGLLVKTLLASVALDNVLCVILFSVAAALVGREAAADSAWIAAVSPMLEVFYSILLGAAVGLVLLFLVRKGGLESFSGLLIAILLTSGGAQALDLSPLMSSLTLGVILSNAGRQNEDLLTSLEHLEPILLTCFFTLAGVALDFGMLSTVGVLGGAYFLARATGKIAGGVAGGYLGSDLPRIRKHLGPALLPQAGLAIGLIVIVQGDPRFSPDLVSTLTNVVLATVVLNEILGPPLVRRSMIKAGEAGKDRRRVVEFLQEEHILTPLLAEDRWDAIGQLAAFLIRTHGIKEVTLEELVESVQERERTFSTAIGSGVALPHARVPSGPEIMGVMGISPKGIDFGAPDEEPVHLIILIATPEEHRERHLEVMRAVALIVSDEETRSRLFNARSPAEAFEAIDTDLKHDYNYFLEE